MKVSILTPTYNRARTLPKLYESIKKNSKFGIEIEWLIMDDGSKDNTKEIIQEFKSENCVNILYEFQENAGKMSALNNLVPKATGDLIIECDSDDYFTDNAFGYIAEHCIPDDNIYAFVFLKYDQNFCNIGNLFSEDAQETTMFDLYFKQGEDGEKALVFNSKIRKEFSYELEHGEKFVTEARMYHKMDRNYKIIGFNTPIMICEYQSDGYSKNITEVFKKSPYGYFEYFKEILQMPLNGVKLKKLMYIYKHYILFSYLTKSKNILSNIPRIHDKIFVALLWLPGIIKTKLKF